MRRDLLLAIAAIFIAPVSVRAADPANDNVISPREITTYTLSTDKGKLKAVKVRRETELLARRADSDFTLYATYSDGLTIDKASAPGSKAEYRSLESDNMFYTGERVCILPLELRKGKKIKAVFEQTYTQPEYFGEIILQSPYYVESGEYRVVIPADIAESVHISSFNLEAGTQIDSVIDPKNNKTYIVQTSAVRPLKSEPLAPRHRVAAPRVLLNANFEDADAVYRFLHSHLWVRTDGHSDAIDSLADKICANAPDQRAEADSIAAWVQNNIRYIADEHSLYGLQPASATEVLEKRFGDCKGSAMLIRQMLRSRGIDGRIVWIGTRSATAYRWSEHPVLACGNHMIAAAFIDGDTLLLDGTAAFAPSGYVLPSLRGQQAMIENDENSCILYDVPTRFPHDLDSIHADLRLEGNDLVGKISRTVSGAMKISLANTYTRADAAHRHKLLERLLAFPRKNAHITHPEVMLGSPAGQSASFSADAVESGVARTIGNEIYLDLRPLRDIMAETVETSDRVRGIRMSIPYRQVSVFDVALPDGVELKEIPDNLTVDNPWFAAAITYSFGDGILHCEASVETRRLDATPDEVKAWNKAVKDVRAISEAQVVLNKTN